MTSTNSNLNSKSKLFSTWTPLNNEEANAKVYEERRQLFGRWYNKWSDSQRRKVLADILEKSTLKQLEFIEGIVKSKVPVYRQDPAGVLPRVIVLYIFSHLDPRSLCRCSQVSWHWKFMSELDQIWMPKCIRLGWLLSFSPSPFEQGLWKRNYIENIESLRCLRPAARPASLCKEVDSLAIESSPRATARSYHTNLSSARSESIDIPLSEVSSILPTTPGAGSAAARKLQQPALPGKRWQPPPWRGSDPTPKDTWRFNYLDNDDQVELIKSLRQKGLSGPISDEIAQAAKSKVKTGKNVLNTKLAKRPKSLVSLGSAEDISAQPMDEQYSVTPQAPPTPPPTRPSWAQANPVQLEQQITSGEFNASLRPRPLRDVRTDYKAWPKPNRDVRELPSSADLTAFTYKPWVLPTQDEADYDA